ncbi:MAG: hypothetical protein DMF59_02345 [Acidobacteria bacterium]|nr:MAG: hypothetical protein DMF59_02345 [Acidobacteriota bacterium]
MARGVDSAIERRTLMKKVIVALSLVMSAVGMMAAPVTKMFIGTWKLNPAKSTFEGVPVMKSQTRIYQDWGGDLVHGRFEGTDTQGTRTVTEYVARYDGRDYPRAVLRSDTIGTIALKKVSERQSEFTYKEDGKITITGTRTISGDGKTSTVRYGGKNNQGQPVRAVLVFDRQ